MSALNENAITRLATVLVDFTTGTPTLIYTVPFGKSLIVDHIVLRAASASLTSVSISFGYNVTCNDLFPNAMHTSIISSLKYRLITPDTSTGPIIGIAGSGLFVKANGTQAATAIIETFGYLI